MTTELKLERTRRNLKSVGSTNPAYLKELADFERLEREEERHG